jgi:cytochrome c oxidase subunit 2
MIKTLLLGFGYYPMGRVPRGAYHSDMLAKKRLALARWACPTGLVILLLAGGCSGPQSTLDPAGVDAARISTLFWWMAGGGLAVWLVVAWLAWSAVRGRVSKHTERQARLYVIGGGVLFPTVVLAGLLVHGLGMMPEMLAPAPPGSLRIAVSGEQWWWRVRYQMPGGDAVELANEIRLPVGEPVEFTLGSPDVIHAFWIPPLGGKVDMIPGRRTRLVLRPTRTGTFRGQCAEFCGDSHALMAFPVVVMEPADFAKWLEAQARPATVADAPLIQRGHEAFLTHGCSACHAVRGTPARGAIGPDLTHVGGRLSLGAGVLPNDPAAFVRWLAETDRVKPGVLMPHFGMLPAAEHQALAAYLESLQ